MTRLRSVCVLFLLIFAVESLAREEVPASADEEFSESLLLRPLPDRKVLSHFHFQSRVPPTSSYGRHHRLFPKSIYQLVHKFRVREMELSFTQGRWNYERWGGFDPLASLNAKPPGVELWAVFDVPKYQVDASWKNLTHALSGLFCASINFLEHSTAYSAPEWSFKSSGNKLRYGTLPREAVCTENLTPWLKLLPCRDKAGLSALMNRPYIYGGCYHSQRLHLVSNDFDSTVQNNGIVLDQTLTVVLHPDHLGSRAILSNGSLRQPNWSLSSLFDRRASGKCVLSKSSTVFVQLDQNLVSEVVKVWNGNERSNLDKHKLKGFWSNPSFELSVQPDMVIKGVDNSQAGDSSLLFKYSIEEHSESRPFDFEFQWKSPLRWSCRQAPFSVSRYLMGSGNERGSIAISLSSSRKVDHVPNIRRSDGKCWMRVYIFQVVPWYVKVYYHTLQIFIDGKLLSVADIVEKMHISPSEDKVFPGVMEMTLKLPCGLKTVALTLEFDKGFLHIDQYPPDANQGFDIPSALLVFNDFSTSIDFLEDRASNKLPLLSKLKESSAVLSYTEVLLVPLTTPDFSMPYNVITITCTVFALYFGSMLKALIRRVGEEERLLKGQATKKSGPLTLLLSKVFAKWKGDSSETHKPPSSSGSSSYKLLAKVVVVAGIAVAWQYFSS